MKDSKQACPKPPPPPRPNLKNKDFVKWSRGESCKKEDNIISTDWHEKLQKTPPFVPVYDNAPLNMTYLLSGEYGRIWQKERDEWYSGVFVLKAKEKDFDDRKKKIRKEIREAKKAAEINLKERKERRAKEAELKAKAEAEKAEKLRARIQKCAAKKPQKPKKKQETKSAPEPPPEPKQSGCPEGWTQVELTMQCECSDHKKETSETQENRGEGESGASQNKKSEPESPTMCKDYLQQLKDIHDSKNKESLKDSTELNSGVKSCMGSGPGETEAAQ